MKDHLLINVDCTNMNVDFRNELSMASRDRLKQGEELGVLRRVLADNLRKGQLQEIYKRRKATISIDAEDDGELLRSFADTLPISNELRVLLGQTFELDQKDKQKEKRNSNRKNNSNQKALEELHPKRFPSFFHLDAKSRSGRPEITIPTQGSKTVKFKTDVEYQYFDRTDEPAT